ncbi:MAG: DUF2520 domain-containing protein [Clostridiales Family XIII bacterium]|jgi:predicted short-subunit dehydrogenase-like oxidoreductase (DUF2520 family)|nr:DUF2520 domain-containing protein [Clostridiales Family XIII bacterium]
MRIGFVGAGKAGCSFGKLIAEKRAMPGTSGINGGSGSDHDLCGISVSGYVSRTFSSAEYAAGLTGSRAFASSSDFLDASDVIFLTVPDGAIAPVWDALRELPGARGKLFCHMSGSLTSELFGMSNENLYGSLHPALAIANRETAWQGLADAYYTYDGSDEAYNRIELLITALGLRVERIAAETKTLYHAACVFASNLVCGLAYDAEKLLRECGLSERFASGAWKMLFAGNAQNIMQTDPVSALTGPAERGDAATIANHLAALDALTGDAGKAMRDTYAALTATLAEMAERRHPERDYAKIKEIVQKWAQ